MNQEHIETLLRFTGDWPTLPVFAVALALAVLMFFFYRRELRFHSGPARRVLPLLRSLAVFVLVLCFAGPVPRRVTTFRQLGRVVIVADASASMSFTDEIPQSTSANPPSAIRHPQPPSSRFDR